MSLEALRLEVAKLYRDGLLVKTSAVDRQVVCEVSPEWLAMPREWQATALKKIAECHFLYLLEVNGGADALREMGVGALRTFAVGPGGDDEGPPVIAVAETSASGTTVDHWGP